MAMDLEDLNDAFSVLGDAGKPKRWLTDEQYASGEWERFAIERVLPLILGTRIQTRTFEFIAQTGFYFYTPKEVEEIEMVNINPDWADAGKYKIVLDLQGVPVTLLKENVPQLLQGINLFPKMFTTGRPGVNGAYEPDPEKMSLLGRIASKINWKRKTGNLTPKQEEENAAVDKDAAELQRLVDQAPRRKVRYWIPTPILADSFVQSPRLPFDMIPKWHLDEETEMEREIRRRVWHEARDREVAMSWGVPYYEIDDEFVDYQYCGVPGMDEELIRAYRLNTEPRVAKLPLHLRRLQQNDVKLWKRKGGRRLLIPRWLEDQASISMRVHRRLAGKYVTAEQVSDGLDLTKAKMGFDDDPAKMVSWAETYTLLIEDVYAEIQKRLVALSKSDLVEASDKQEEIRKYFEGWLSDNYDRMLPNEQHGYHERFIDIHKIHDGSWESQADRWFNELKLRIHVKKPPTVRNTPGRWANFLDMEVFAADFESWRNLEHSQEHWKYSKAMWNTRSAFNADKNAAQSMRQKDWGGIWNNTRAEKDWRWSLLNRISPIPENRPMSDRGRKLRMQLMSAAWFDKRPWQSIDHDGSLIERLGQKMIGWIEGMGGIKGLSSRAGTFDFPRSHNGDLAKEKSKYRNYTSEYDLLRNDEYFARDPVDVIENQKGIAVFSIIDDVNLRLYGRFPDKPAVPATTSHPAIPAWDSPVRLNYDNCFAMQAFAQLMYEHLPPDPIVKAVEASMGTWERKNILHFRPEINKMLDGVHINVDLRPYVEKWYRLSDERVWDYVYYHSAMMSTIEGGPSGAEAWGIKECADVCYEGYGLGYGSAQMQQSRQEKMIEVGLYTGYYSVMKGVLEWWSVRVTATKLFDTKSWPDINDLKTKIAGLLESRKLIWPVAEHMLWPKLRTLQLIKSDEPFPIQDEYANSIDSSYIMELLNTRAGVDHIPTLEELDSFTDPAVKAVVEGVRKKAIEDNMARYLKVAEGRFFE